MTLPSKFVLLIVCAGLLGCAGAPRSGTQGGGSLSPAEKSELLVRAAEGALREGDYAGMSQLLLDAEKLTPKSAEIPFVRASSYYVRQDYSAALTQLKLAIERNPNFSHAHNMLGKIYLDRNETVLAEKHLRIAAFDELFRDNYKALTSLGILFYRKNQNQNAREMLDRAIANQPNAACMARYFRGHLAMKVPDYSAAIADYSAATKRQCGTMAEAHFALATAYERSGQYDLARKKYLEIQQVFPRTAHASQAMNQLSKLP